MSCLGDCLELGPPPNTILFLPPPPVPSFLSTSQIPDFLLLNTTPCSAAQLCESPASAQRPHDSIVIADGGEYLELPRKDIENWSGIGDTWLLVLVASSIGVLLLGALLAMFLLKCREMNMFDANDCSMHRPMKNHEPRDCTSVTNINGTKLVHPSEIVLYHGHPQTVHDNRMVWAALTPRGTQHFISENYPPDLIDYREPEDHYETIDNVEPVGLPAAANTLKLSRDKSSFENSGFVDYYDYEDPAPLIESYQLNNMEYQTIGNNDMRCASTLRRSLPITRPRVSSPTRIEHPNLPPLNLYPHSKCNTLKKNSTLSGYKTVDGSGTLPKYGL